MKIELNDLVEYIGKKAIVHSNINDDCALLEVHDNGVIYCLIAQYSDMTLLGKAVVEPVVVNEKVYTLDGPGTVGFVETVDNIMCTGVLLNSGESKYYCLPNTLWRLANV